MNYRKPIRALVLSIAAAVASALPSSADTGAGAYLAARSAEQQHDFAAASQYYIRALTKDPGNRELMERAVLSLIGMGDITRALPIARQLAGADPESQVAGTLLLAEAVRNNDFDAAYRILREAGRLGPLIDGLSLAWVQAGQGRMSQALESFDAVARQEGLQSFAAYHKALALAMVGNLEAAEAILSGTAGPEIPATRRSIIARVEILSQLERNREAIELLYAAFGSDFDPGLARLRSRLAAGETLPLSIVRDARDGVAEVFFGVAGALMGEGNDGYTLLYTRITQYLRPDNEDAIILAAQLLERLGRYELATAAYESISPDSPAYEAAELGRARTLRLAGDPEAAVEALERLAERFPDQAAVHVALGDELRRMKRYEEAGRAYSRAIALYGQPEPSQWSVYFARGITYERTDQWEKAEADFRKALELEPDQPQVLNYLGYSYVEMNTNLDEALEMIRTAVQKRPDSGYITDSLGWVLYRLGRYDEAVVQMERAVELMPMDPILNDHLGDVYWAVGRQREARFQWSRALSLDPEEKDAARIRRKLEVGLDAVLEEEGAEPLAHSNGG